VNNQTRADGVTWTLADVERSIPDAFAEQVRRRPDQVAVSGTASPLTYGEIDALANFHAHVVLDRCGLGPGRIALLMAEDAPLFAATLGALKAGKTAVVLNPSDPPARLEQVLRDARPELVVADTAHAPLVRSAGASAYNFLTIGERSDNSSSAPPNLEVDPGGIAFLVYTSGSTGPPKGVIHTHRTFLHKVWRMTNYRDTRPADRVPLLVSTSVIGGSSPLWNTLLNGATVCPFPVAVRGMAGLAPWLAEQEITLVSVVSSLFRHIVRTLDGESAPPVRSVMLGGEPVLPADVEACRAAFGPDCEFVCGFGSTEAGTLTIHRVTGDMDLGSGPLPAGRAVEGVDLMLLDDAGRPVAPGQTGEIVAGSPYLTPGYWADEALTAARFSEDRSGRWFRTGDLGQWSPERVLTLGGRTDLQVKVRGNRISLTTVEAALAALPGVTGAAACARPTPRGDNKLVAYLTTRAGANLTAADARQALRARLPERELPTAFVFVDSFPITSRGKVDREQLARIAPPSPPAPGVQPATSDASETEETLAAIWAGAFELEHVGPEDDFFDLGGDSLTAAVIAAGVHAAFGVQLELGAVIDSPTVVQIARTIEVLQSRRTDDDRPALTRASRAGPLPMSFAQERTWLTSQTPQQSAGYTDATTIRIRGPLDVTLLRRSLDHLFRRHEMLRTTFTERDGQPIQVVHPPQPVDLPLIDLAGTPDPEARAAEMLAQEAGAGFDLQRGPLLRLRLVRTAPDEHHLLWIDHHIITDAWSSRVFFGELRQLYGAFERGEPAPLADELPFQYADFAAWERGWLQPSTPHFKAEMAWWREALEDAPPLQLPFMRATPHPDASPSDGVIYWGLAPEVARGLDRLGRETAATYYMVRLAVLAAHLAIETEGYDVVLGTYATGRALPETQAMFGFFSNVVTLRLRLAPDLTFRQVLERVRACVTDTSPHTDFPYELLCEQLRNEGIVAPEIRLIFNPSNQPPLRISNLEVTRLGRRYATMPWGFTFGLNRHCEATDCGAAFDARVHDPAGVRGFLDRFQELAAEVGREPDRRLDAVLART
jgi:amino acid adenylation domain-containing protein